MTGRDTVMSRLKNWNSYFLMTASFLIEENKEIVGRVLAEGFTMSQVDCYYHLITSIFL